MKLNVKIIIKYTTLFLCAAAVGILYVCAFSKTKLAIEVKKTLKIALPYTTYIDDINTNYYKEWLEEQSGYSLEFIYINENYTREYLRLIFSSENSDIDAVFFPADADYMTEDTVLEFGQKGYILPLEGYIANPNTNIQNLFSTTTEYDLEAYMTSADSHIYYMPSVENYRQSKNAQVLWINANWLQALGLEIPKTTEEFKSVLTAFKERDPNGNNIADEIPLIGCELDASLQSYDFLLNAFVYTDPQNNYLLLEDKTLKFAPTTEEWREALIYCRELYENELLCDRSFTYSENQFKQLVNDKQDVVGAFTSKSIGEVVNQDSVEILYKYIGVTPIKGPDGVQLATVQASLPTVGAVVTSKCKNPQAVFKLLDLMLAEEASVIGKYGEEGIDWEPGRIGDISQYGSKATIYVKQNLVGKAQNSTLAGNGPGAVPSSFLNGTTWNGVQSDRNYIDVQVAVNYEAYYPKEHLNTISTQDDTVHKTGQEIQKYAHSMLVDFITGEVDMKDETKWQQYLGQYEKLHLSKYLKALQMQLDE